VKKDASAVPIVASVLKTAVSSIGLRNRRPRRRISYSRPAALVWKPGHGQASLLWIPNQVLTALNWNLTIRTLDYRETMGSGTILANDR